MKSLKDLFGVEKPILGMIHLYGTKDKDRLKRGMEELEIYNEEDVDGVIIDDFISPFIDFCHFLDDSSKQKYKFAKGINHLYDPYLNFDYAQRFGCQFALFNSIQKNSIISHYYDLKRNKFSDIFVIGGVDFRLSKPTNESVKSNLMFAKDKCDAIVTSTRIKSLETPIPKLNEYKSYLGDFPLFTGSGVCLDNVQKQLSVADGAIIETYFKEKNDISLPVDRYKVRDFMDAVKELRN